MEDKESHGTVNESDIEEPFEIKDVLEKLPKKGKILKSIGPFHRELLNDVQNLTFLVKDEAEALHTVKEKLEDIIAMLKFNKNMKICCWSHNKQKIEKEKLT